MERDFYSEQLRNDTASDGSGMSETYNPGKNNSTIPMDTVEKRTSYNPETKRWCCAMYGAGYWTGGFFGDSKEEAEKLATENYKKNVADIKGWEAARLGEQVEYVVV